MCTSVLDVEVYPKMLRKKSKAVPEGNSPVPQDAYVMLGGITVVKLRRVMSEALDKAVNKHFGPKPKNSEEMRATDQRLAELLHGAQQPRLAMEADGKSDTKTRKRVEDATAYQAKHEDSCSAKKVQAGPTSSTNFGMKAESPALPHRDDVLVDKSAAAPKACPSPVKMSTLTATGDLLPAGTASAATTTIFHQPPLSFCLTEEKVPGHHFNTRRTRAVYGR